MATQKQKNNRNELSTITVKPSGLNVKRGGNIFIGTVNIFVRPAKNRWHRHYHPKNKSWHWHLLIDAVLSLIIIGLIVMNLFLYFGQNIINLNDKINLTVKTEPQEITSGQDLNFIINYSNNSKIKLNDVKLAVKFPEKYLLKETAPDARFNNQTNTFNLGEIDSGGNGAIQIRGVIYGQVDENQKITATINFSPENSKSRKQKYASYNYHIAKSNVAGDLELPAKIFRGQPFDAIIRYFNNSNYDISELIIRPAPENNFHLLSSSLPLADKIWVIKNLKAKSAGQINFSGKFDDEAEGAHKIKIFFAIVAGDKQFRQAEISQETEMVRSKFLLTLKSATTNITPGDEADYVLIYKNGEKFPLENVKITANIDSPFAPDKKISWDKLSTPALSKIKAGQEGEIKFNLKIKSKIEQTSAEQKNFTLSISPETTYQLPKPENLSGFSAGDKLIQKINTALNLQATARYYTDEGDQLGIGPLPPVIGAPTKYWIFFKIENLYNDVKNISIAATLSRNVSWTGKISTTADQGVIYNQNNGQLSWGVGSVGAPAAFLPDIGAAFEVELLPTADQSGRLANLIENIQISGLDEFTGQKITKKIPAITTALDFDQDIKTDGRVRAE